jgi:WD40 repeat protein
MKETQLAETEKRSSARLRYFLAGFAILLLASACDAPTRQELATLKGQHGDVILGVAVSPDGKTLAAVSWDEIVMWDARTRQELATLKEHAYGVTSVAFSPDGKTLASGSWDHTVKLWMGDARQ